MKLMETDEGWEEIEELKSRILDTNEYQAFKILKENNEFEYIDYMYSIGDIKYNNMSIHELVSEKDETLGYITCFGNEDKKRITDIQVFDTLEQAFVDLINIISPLDQRTTNKNIEIYLNKLDELEENKKLVKNYKRII